jgi:hypothetical protein
MTKTIARAALAATIATLPLGCGRQEEAPPPPPVQATTTVRATLPPTTTTLRREVAPSADAPVLSRRSSWEVGDVVTTDATFTLVERVSKLTPDGATEPQRTNDQVIKTTWLEKCLEVDADGARTKYLVVIPEWLRTTPDARDESLRGAFVSVSGRGAARAWHFVGKDAETTRTAAATTWLDERFGRTPADDEELLHMMLVDRPVRVGETWTPDVSALAATLRRNGMIVDRERIQASGKLEALHDGVADCLFRASFPLTRLPGVGELGIRWTRGGVFAVEHRMSIPVSGRLLLESRATRHATLEGDARTAEATMRVDFTQDEARTVTIGGAFPAAPAD